jgi:predicted HicB family RNase H-like nuclease
MPEAKPKPKKVGRPTLPKGEAKGKIIALRLNAEDVKRVSAAAKARKLSVSEWIRSTLNAAMAN